jgi:hypothetical protein
VVSEVPPGDPHNMGKVDRAAGAVGAAWPTGSECDS